MAQKEMDLVDERMMYRINRTEREKERQKKKHQQKIEHTDWLSLLNEEGDDNGRSNSTN